MLFSKITRQVCLWVALFILLIEAIIFIFSIDARYTQLKKTESYIEYRLKSKGIQTTEAILSPEYIENDLSKFKSNILILVAIIVIVVTSAVGVIFQLTVVRDINKLVQINKKTSLNNILFFPVREIPKNEIGLVIKARNEMLLEMKNSHIEATQNKAALGMVKLSNKVSHEILNPLTVIFGNLDIILAKPEEIPPKTKALLQKIEAQSLSIQLTVTDLIKLSESILYQEIEIFDIKELLQDIVLKIKTTTHKNFSLKFHSLVGSTKINARKLALNYAFEAFALSSISALTNTDKTVSIQLETIDKNFIVIKIEDTGPSAFAEISNQLDIEKLTTNDIGRGAGFKLFFAKAMIEASGGTVEITSTNESNSFAITLPCC